VIRATGGARPRAVRAATLARAVLVLLVAAAVYALFRDQELKREAPLVNGHSATTRFHPQGPPPRAAHFHLRLSVGDVVDVTILAAATDRAVDLIARNRRVREYRKFELIWNGSTAAGTPAPSGRYVVEVRLEHAGRTVVVPGFQLVLEGGTR
jgi:hypothetical protein